MIFTRQQYHGPMLPRTAQIGQPHLIGDPHRAMGLAIPKGINISARGKLTAQNGGGSRFFIDAKLVDRAALSIERFELLDEL